jgi:hypothetical protein
MQTDYKSHELNLYSNDNVGRLRFVDGKGTGLGPGFGQQQEYIFAKYTDSANGNMQWPVCIPELHTIDNSTGYVMGVGWYIMDTRSKVDDEKTRASSAEAQIAADLYSETQTRASADETLTITTNLAAEGKIRSDADTKLTTDLADEVANRAAAVSAVDGKLTVERTRAIAAEGVVQANVEAEAKERASEVKRIDGRIDFITSNVDAVAIDSLSEIVSQFSQNGQGYASRLTYLESVVAALVNKSQ